jgi:predicted GIY-YIG superfamily endonuclease
VVYSEKGHTRSSACQRESAIKKLTRNEKLAICTAASDSTRAQP